MPEARGLALEGCVAVLDGEDVVGPGLAREVAAEPWSSRVPQRVQGVWVHHHAAVSILLRDEVVPQPQGVPHLRECLRRMARSLFHEDGKTQEHVRDQNLTRAEIRERGPEAVDGQHGVRHVDGAVASITPAVVGWEILVPGHQTAHGAVAAARGLECRVPTLHAAADGVVEQLWNLGVDVVLQLASAPRHVPSVDRARGLVRSSASSHQDARLEEADPTVLVARNHLHLRQAAEGNAVVRRGVVARLDRALASVLNGVAQPEVLREGTCLQELGFVIRAPSTLPAAGHAEYTLALRGREREGHEPTGDVQQHSLLSRSRRWNLLFAALLVLFVSLPLLRRPARAAVAALLRVLALFLLRLPIPTARRGRRPGAFADSAAFLALALRLRWKWRRSLLRVRALLRKSSKFFVASLLFLQVGDLVDSQGRE
mmetsp:Transcript_148832/g.478065  ORF Transcript_148832/g.478065 Transcript_148832/m.478065 type:complete len:429 (+) Transcript_148832:1516-2802(+)